MCRGDIQQGYSFCAKARRPLQVVSIECNMWNVDNVNVWL